MMLIMKNCLCRMAGRWNALSIVSGRDCFQSISSSYTSTPREGFKPAQNLSSGFVEWSSAIVLKAVQEKLNLQETVDLVTFFVKI